MSTTDPTYQMLYGPPPRRTDAAEPTAVVPTATAPPPAARNRKPVGDRFGQLRSFVALTLPALKRRNDVAVWIVLFNATNADDGTALIRHATIAEGAGCDESTVKRCIKRLKATGLLSVVRQGGYRKGSSIYRVHPVAPDGSVGP